MPHNPHPTKSGPGRIHRDGEKHGSAPVTPKGAPFGFVLHQASAAKKMRRAMTALWGRRIARRNQRWDRALAEARRAEADQQAAA